MIAQNVEESFYFDGSYDIDQEYEEFCYKIKQTFLEHYLKIPIQHARQLKCIGIVISETVDQYINNGPISSSGNGQNEWFSFTAEQNGIVTISSDLDMTKNTRYIC